ncbi:MAG: serine hydrolase domain-containing protein [Rhodospirillaceae bacterium]
MRTTGKLLAFGIIGFALCASLAGCKKKEEAAAPAASSPRVAASLNAADVEKWSDETFGKILAEHRVSALAIAVTEGDKVVFTKGYGYADWANKTPVNPETTQFRIASLTKTFVGTAVAQLLEAGKIASLDDPVNKYLKRFQLKNATGKDVTIWNLLTHRGGLAMVGVTVAGEDGPDRPTHPLPGDYIAARMSEVVREPGTLSHYCNPCTATLGFMVEDITGQTLQDYMKEHVYTPLGMTHTEITNAAHPGPDVVTQYAFVPDGPPVALPYPVITPAFSYAGDTNSTAVDMSKWLIAHTMEANGPGAKILSAKSFDLMHTRKVGNVPEESGFGMQFFIYDYNGEKVMEHYGSLAFRSMEFFMMNKKIGVFVPEPGPVEPAMSHSGVRALVLEHFLGKLPLKPDLKLDVAKYVGTYHSIPANPNDKPGGAPMTVVDSGDGGLVIAGVGVYRPSGPDEFTLDGPLPLQAGFRDSNKFKFTIEPNGAMRMWEHINAGGLERDPS